VGLKLTRVLVASERLYRVELYPSVEEGEAVVMFFVIAEHDMCDCSNATKNMGEKKG